MKLNIPSKFNKTRHSNQEGAKTSLAFGSFQLTDIEPKRTQSLKSKVKCESKAETILDFQEKQMLERLVCAVQTRQRVAI